MVRNGALVLLSLLLVLPLAGCWSRKELNDLGIVVGMGLDKKGDGYEVTVQVVNPGQVSTRNGISPVTPPVSTFSERGRTVAEAVRRMTTNLSKKLYLSHLRILVFGEQLARDGIAKPIDFISRDRQFRNDFYLIVAHGSKASDVLKIFSPIDPIPANNLNNKLSNADRLWAAAGQITLDRLMMDLMDIGKSPTLTGIRIVGDIRDGEYSMERIEPAAVLEYYGMAVFRRDRMVGWLDEDGTKALNYLQDRVNQTVATIRCPQEGAVSVNVTDVKTRVRVARSGDEPIVNVKLHIEADVADAECRIDLSKVETLDWIRRQLADKTEDILERGIKQAQREFHSDIFGFGRHVHRQQAALWHRIGDNWEEQFSRLKVRIDPVVQIRRVGTIDRSIEQVMKE